MGNPQAIVEWFRDNKRELPWRASRDPYRIWISETMLQQTTTTAVIPYFERFIKTFPTLSALAEAPETKVLEAWAGLGYYSRARNLHKAAKELNRMAVFPQSYKQLIELPGLGPYTARAVSSIAFGEKVGVVDGNVIRVFSRLHARKWEWWKPAARAEIQKEADAWTEKVPSQEVNQALMELGRTICTPKSPSCLLCPLRAECLAHAQGKTEELPLPKPRRAKEIWWWRPEVHQRGGKVGFVRNTQLPFLKGQWLLPGAGESLKTAPKRYDYRHSITHYDIFVTVNNKAPKIKASECRWIAPEEIQQHVPTSLVIKALRPSDSAHHRGVRQPTTRRSQSSRAKQKRR